MNGEFQPAVLILAAGKSSRMGKPKLLLPWRGTTILGHLVALWRGLGAEPVTIVQADDQVLERELDRLDLAPRHRIQNRQPDRGMFSSIQEGARSGEVFSSATHIAIVLGDQPHVPRQLLKGFLRFAAGHPERVVQPALHGRAKHPVILPHSYFQSLAFSQTQTLKQFLASASPALWLCDDPALELDIDTPDDYARALKLDISHTD